MAAHPTAAVSAGEVLAALSLATDLGTDQPLEHGLRTAVLCAGLAVEAGGDDDLCSGRIPPRARARDRLHERRPRGRRGVRRRPPYRSDPAAIDRRARPSDRLPWRRTAESRSPQCGLRRGGPGRRRRRPLGADRPLRGRRALRRAAGAPEERQRRAVARVRALGRQGAAARRRRGRDRARGPDAAPRPRRRRPLAAGRRPGRRHDVHGARGQRLRSRARRPGALRAAGDPRGARREPAWEAALARAAHAPGGAERRRARRRVPGRRRVRRPGVGLHPGHSPAVAELGEAAAWRLGLGRATSPSCAAPASSTTSGAWPCRPASGSAPAAEHRRVGARAHAHLLGRARAGPLRRPGRGRSLAARHHERLDGRGYHRGAAADDISLGARSSPPPPSARPSSRVRTGRGSLGRIARELDPESSPAASTATRSPRCSKLPASAAGPRRARSRPGSPRARSRSCGSSPAGCPTRRSPPSSGCRPRPSAITCSHVYAKAGVSTRAAAALFAVEHGLLGP